MSLSRNSSTRTTSASRDAIRCSVDGQSIRVEPGGTSAFERTDDPPRAYKNTPTAGRITGFGDEYDSCGTPHPHFCSECGEPITDQDGELVEIGETCWRQECPRCGAGWAMRRGIPIVSKMESLRTEITARRNGDSPRFHHVAIIMTDFRSNRDADDAYFDVAKHAIEEVAVNLFGGALVHHSYTGEDEEDDLDKWKERLFSGRDWEGDVEDELKEWHHIHGLVLADSVDHLSCEALQDKTNILIHRIQDEDEDTNVSLYGPEDLADATTYALSHARLSDNADAYRYFGEVANHSADHRVEARCREVVRSVVPKTLDLNPADGYCSREIGIDEVDRLPDIDWFNYDTDTDDSGDDGDETEKTDDQEDSAERDDTAVSEVEEPDSPENDATGPGDDDANPGCDDAEGEDSGPADDVTGDNTEGGADNGDSQDDAETPDSGGCGVHCNGRLVPLKYAPNFLDDDDCDLQYADELRAAYQEWDPPPGNADITSYAED